MATIKKRINISLPKDLDKFLAQLAKRDEVPQASKAVSLLRVAIELEEDALFNQITENRDKKNAKFIGHKKAWA